VKYSPKPVVQPQRRLRSEHVAYGVIGALVLACCGFGVYRYQNDKECVDPNSLQVIDRSYCRTGGHGRWYYGGYSNGIGSKATGGSFERGGFGGRFGGGS
jgi:hypothetical protein